MECSKCLLDTNDYPEIFFDEKGVCNICHTYDSLARRTVLSGNQGKLALEKLIEDVKRAGKGNEYNCIIGVSGGVDSSYLACLTKEWGLNPLVVHVDGGWNTELAVSNIDKLIKKLDFDLFTEVLDWEEMRDIQHSLIKANVLDIDLAFDNAFMAVLYRLARKYKIKHILSGHNTITEGYLPPNFTHYKLDTLNLRDIQNKFGTRKLKSLPFIGPMEQYYCEKIIGIKFYSPLDWLSYDKIKTKEYLINNFGWRDYGGKHYENVFTRFYQGYILPQKFGIDKRKSHLSTLICSGLISKQQAMVELESSPPYPSRDMMEMDKEYFTKKIGMTLVEFDKYINTPPVFHTKYRSWVNIVNTLRPYYRKLKPLLGK